jgi:hypothetical protein
VAYARRLGIDANLAPPSDAGPSAVDSPEEFRSFVDALVRARLIAPLGLTRPRHAPLVLSESLTAVSS